MSIAVPITIVKNTKQRVEVAVIDGRADHVRVVAEDNGDEIVYWDSAEWRDGACGAFEAILSVITRVAKNEIVAPATE